MNEKPWHHALANALAQQLTYFSASSQALLQPLIKPFLRHVRLKAATESSSGHYSSTHPPPAAALVYEGQSLLPLLLQPSGNYEHAPACSVAKTSPAPLDSSENPSSLLSHSLSLQATPSGYLTLKLTTKRDHYLHSRINPYLEATRRQPPPKKNSPAKSLKSNHIVLLGLDLLYDLELALTGTLRRPSSLNTTSQSPSKLLLQASIAAEHAAIAKQAHQQQATSSASERYLFIFSALPEVLLLGLACRDLGFLQHFRQKIEFFPAPVHYDLQTAHLSSPTQEYLLSLLKGNTYPNNPENKARSVATGARDAAQVVANKRSAQFYASTKKADFPAQVFVPFTGWKFFTTREPSMQQNILAASVGNADKKAASAATERHYQGNRHKNSPQRSVLVGEQLKNELLALSQVFYRETFTRYVFEKRWLKNTLSNIRFLAQCHPFAALRNNYAGRVVFIIGAAPSLDQAYAILMHAYAQKQAWHDDPRRPILLALDSALPTLYAMRLLPDYVVALDGGYYNTLDFSWGESFYEQKLRPHSPRLLAHVSVYPLILKNYLASNNNGRRTSTSDASEVFCFIDDSKTMAAGILRAFALDLSTSRLFTGSSVAQAALSAAVAMGFHHIIFCGIDHTCPFYHSHSFHAMHNQVLLHRSGRLQRLESEIFRYLSAQWKLASSSALAKPQPSQSSATASAAALPTTYSLITYARELSAKIKQFRATYPTLKFYTTSPKALFTAAIPYLEQSEVEVAINKKILATTSKTTAKPQSHHNTKNPPFIVASKLAAASLKESTLATYQAVQALQLKVDNALRDHFTQSNSPTGAAPPVQPIQASPANFPCKPPPSAMMLLREAPHTLHYLEYFLHTYRTLLRQEQPTRLEILLLEELRRLVRISSVKIHHLLQAF